MTSPITSKAQRNRATGAPNMSIHVAICGTSTIGLMNFGSSRDERGRWPSTSQAVNQVA